MTSYFISVSQIGWKENGNFGYLDTVEIPSTKENVVNEAFDIVREFEGIPTQEAQDRVHFAWLMKNPIKNRQDNIDLASISASYPEPENEIYISVSIKIVW